MSLGKNIWSCQPPMPLMDVHTENGRLIGKLNEATIAQLKTINKKVQVVWSIGKWKEYNALFFNNLKYKWFREYGLETQKSGIWCWVSDHLMNKDMSLLFVESVPTGVRALDFELGFMACLLSSTLVWNIDEEGTDTIEDIGEIFSYLPEIS